MIQLYPFDDVRKHFQVTDRMFMRVLKNANVPYLKVGHKKWFTQGQLNTLYKEVTCYPSTDVAKRGTSVELSPVVTEWLKSGELQDSLTSEQQKPSSSK